MVDAKRKNFVGGNWKSNGDCKFVESMIKDTLNAMEYNKDRCEVLVAPVFLHLGLAKTHLASHIHLSAQNCNDVGNGAYTGEVSADQLVEFGLQWVILGHSERRAKYGETNEKVAAKVKYALSKGLNVVLCIGEQLEQRNAG